MERLKKYRFMPPYTKEGKATFRNLRHRKGVYIIKENDKIVYVGYSATQLYKTIYRHFQEWEEVSLIKGKPLYHTTYKGKRKKYTVRVILTNRTRQAQALEKKLILKYKPRDNKQKYKGYKESDYENEIFKEYINAKVEMKTPF